MHLQFVVSAIILGFIPKVISYDSSYCFPANGVELRAAVKEYFYGGKNDGSIGTWCVDNVRDFRNLFKNVNTEDFQTVDLGSWNLESATNIANMFLGAKKYQGVGIGKWNVSNVKAMNNAFRDCLNFNEDLGEWDVSSVLSMRGMFRNADKFDGTSIVGWNVQKVKNFDEMFRYSNAVNADLSGWNIASFPASHFCTLPTLCTSVPFHTKIQSKLVCMGRYTFAQWCFCSQHVHICYRM